MREFKKERSFEIVCVNKCPYMFTNIRIDRDSIPDGFVAYDVRDDCDGEFLQIQNFVLVNHWGTIIGIERLPMDPEWNCYYPTEDDGWFTGDYVESGKEYLERYSELRKECRQSEGGGRKLSPKR